MTRTATFLGQEICEALGIDPKYVAAISIEHEAGELPVLTVRRQVFADQELQMLRTIIERYELRTKDETSQDGLA